MSWLCERDRQPELMDQPGLSDAEHHRALMGLRRANMLSGTVKSIWKPIHQLALAAGNRPIRVLDVASGGGDIAIGIWKKAQKHGIDVRVHGCDISTTAIDYANENAARQRSDVGFFHADAINDGLPSGHDVVCSSLFLHHLEEHDVIQLLKTMRQQAAEMVVVSDLLRSRIGYILCWLGIRIVSRSKICHVDGPLSVQGAFTVSELKKLAEAADMYDMDFQCLWPQRCLMLWHRN